MDSLLREIDDEMENTGNSEWNIPPQDRGDEKIETLVNPNREENRNLQENNERNTRRIVGSQNSPYKKTVGFSEGVELHEYAKAPEELTSYPEEHLQDLDTAWRQSRPNQPQIPKQQLPPLPFTEESEDEREPKEEPELTVDELKEHSINDTSDKLSNMFDSRQNMYHLKQMAQTVDSRADQIGYESNQRKLSLVLEPTQHLLSNEDSADESGNEEDDEEEDDEYEGNESLGIAQSPSKIPLTNTININNYSLENIGGHSRASSGSSYAESASELETTTIGDRYKLLGHKAQVPTELQYRTPEENDSPLAPPKFTKHPNSSNAFSFTTDYESARETANGSVSDFASEAREASVENLGIPTGVKESSPASEQDYLTENSHHDDTLREEEYKSPDTTANESKHSRTFDGGDEESRNKIEYAGLHEVSSSYGSEDDGDNDVAPQTEWSRLTEDLNESIEPRNGSRVSSNGSRTSQGSNKEVKKGKLKRLSSSNSKVPNLPSLVPVVELGPIFNEDPFEEIFDSSGDSLDLTRSVKPSDYISIWHSQADGLKSHSPATSTNSQFSQHSVSSQSSTTSVSRNEFRFKPRIVSRCRYYNPENRIVIPSDSEDDDDMLYAVDHALDPRSRNTLITKQLRNSLRQNKKYNPLRLAALGLQAQGATKQEEDGSSPLNDYPITLAPTGNTADIPKEPIPEVKQEEDTTVKFKELDKELDSGPPQTSDFFELQSYEHLAAFANTPEVSRTEAPRSPHVERDFSMPHIAHARTQDSLPAFSPKQIDGKSPIIIPPRNTSRQTGVPILTPPPRNINRKTGSPMLAPAPSFSQADVSPLASTSVREENSPVSDSLINEFETPPASLSKGNEEHDSSVDSHQQQELDKLSIDNPEELNLRVSLSERGLTDDLGRYFETLSPDNQSIEQSIRTKRGGYNLWSPEFDLTDGGNRRSSMSSEILNKLLESENGAENTEANQSRNSESSQGYIKTPIDNVFIGRGLSVNGLEAVVSNEEASERNSVLFNEFHDGNLYQTPTHNPMGKMHVGSPFKPVSPNKSPNRGQGKSEDLGSKQKDIQLLLTPQSQGVTKANPHSESSPDLEPDSKLEHISKPVTNSSFVEEEEITKESSGTRPHHISTAHKPHASISSEAISPEEASASDHNSFPDAGNLYFRLRDISGIKLDGVNRRNAQFAFEFDNGKNVAQTPWQSMDENGRINLNREFEAILDKNPRNQRKIIMTLKCRYGKIVYEPEMEEVIEKVPVVSKKKFFGKKKEHYEFQRKLVQKPAKEDEWDFIFARDGSFGRCELILDEDFLNHAKFQIKTIKLDLKNEWARQQGPPGKKPHQLPRKAPYILGQLKLDTCYLARSSSLEKFPKSLAIARGIMTKYTSQQSISKEGYLMQKGGDLGKDIVRRFFKLQGNNLVGYHEVTRKAKIIINLLKVSDVIGPTEVRNEDFNEDLASQSSFHLIFANKETITFDTEFSTDEKYDWYRNVKYVVELNKSHQPWVKAIHENFIINGV